MQERKIDLVDLIVEILLRWRVLIICMLVGAVLAGCYSYVSSSRAAAAQKETVEQQRNELAEQMKDKESAQENLLKEITEAQKKNVLNVCADEEIVKYYEGSMYLQMDATKVPKTELSYLVKTSVLEDSYSIERLYEDTLESGLQQWLADNGQKELGDISELVSLDRGTGSVETDSFCVQIIHVSEEQCRELAQQVVEYITARHAVIAKLAGKHEIVLINSSFAFVKDNAVLNQQKNLMSTIRSMESSINQSVTAFSEEEKAYYEFLTNVKLEEVEAQSEESFDDTNVKEDVIEEIITPGVSIERVILGMLLFVAIYVCYVTLPYVLNNRIRATDKMAEIYGVPQLGLIPTHVAEKKLFDSVDRLIMQLHNRNRRIFTTKEALGLTGVAVRISAKKESLDEVCCIGCNMKEEVLETAAEIKKVLEEDHIGMTVLNNVLYDQESMQKLQIVKGAFLLEKAGETLYDEIEKEIELLKRQGVKILGIVVAE